MPIVLSVRPRKFPRSEHVILAQGTLLATPVRTRSKISVWTIGWYPRRLRGTPSGVTPLNAVTRGRPVMEFPVLGCGHPGF